MALLNARGGVAQPGDGGPLGEAVPDESGFGFAQLAVGAVGEGHAQQGQVDEERVGAAARERGLRRVELPAPGEVLDKVVLGAVDEPVGAGHRHDIVEHAHQVGARRGGEAVGGGLGGARMGKGVEQPHHARLHLRALRHAEVVMEAIHEQFDLLGGEQAVRAVGDGEGEDDAVVEGGVGDHAAGTVGAASATPGRPSVRAVATAARARVRTGTPRRTQNLPPPRAGSLFVRRWLFVVRSQRGRARFWLF